MNRRQFLTVYLTCLSVLVLSVFRYLPEAHAALPHQTLAVPAADPPPPPVDPNDPLPNVVGGTNAPQGAWPWTVALVSARSVDVYQGQFCGGSLIAPEWVLTAAHCVVDSFHAGVLKPDELDVVLGRQDLTSSAGERVDVSAVIPFPSYEFMSFPTRDYALLQLATPSTRKPIALVGPEDSARTAPDTLAAIAGWGRLAYGGGNPAVLQQAMVPIVANEVCNGPYGGQVTSAHICAGYVEGGVDTCQGDSGGPLMVPDEAGGWLLAGVTSYGEGCAYPNFYGVYSRVAPIKSWVEAILSSGPHVSIVKSAPPLASPDSSFRYTLRIDNSGMTQLTGLVVTDIVPPGVKLLDSGSGTRNGNVLTWKVTSLPAGANIEFSYTVSANATVESAFYGVQTTNGVSAVGQFPTRTLINAPHLALAISSHGPFLVGRELTYTLSLQNDGLGTNATAHTIKLSNTLPKNVEYVRGGTFADGVVSWDVPSLDTGSVITREVVVRPLIAGTIFNNFYGASYGANQTVFGERSRRDTISGADLSIRIDGPITAMPATPITYALTVINEGDLEVRNMVISYTLPLGAVFVGTDGDGAFADGVVTWNRSSLSSGKAAIYHVTVAASHTLVSRNYGARGEDFGSYEYHVVGEKIVTTAVNQIYLPIVVRAP